MRVSRHGGVTAQDLAAAGRQSGREVALYRDAATGERFVAIGERGAVQVPKGSRLIARTQPGQGAAAVRPSVADEAALARLGQRSSVIIDEAGTAATRFRVTEEGTTLARTAEDGPVTLNAPRTFASKDPLVADLANEIERAFPGHVVDVTVPVKDAMGKLVTDADIQLQNSIIQVKSGGGKGKKDQLERTEAATGLPTIGYGPDLKGSVVKSIEEAGGLVTRDKNLLIEVTKP